MVKAIIELSYRFRLLDPGRPAELRPSPVQEEEHARGSGPYDRSGS
jgi:hypothetical protein